MFVSTRRSFLVLAAAATLSACGEYLPTTATALSAASPQDMVDAINAIRRKLGKSSLKYSAQMAQMAMNQAQLMVSHDQLSHNFGPGLDLRSRATAVGYHGAVGENVAAGQKTLEDALAGWMNSPPHRSTLLSDMFDEVGMVGLKAKAGSKYGIYWAADFGV